MDGDPRQANSDHDQSKLVGSWRGTSRQNGQSASVQVTSLDGLNAQVQFIVNRARRRR